MQKDSDISADDILELTDIVEEGTLPEKNNGSTSESSFEDELDSLFGDVENLDDLNDVKEAPINAHEKLDMPDMSDLDSLMDDLGTDPERAEPIPQPKEETQIDGVDELLADILPKTPAETKDATKEAKPVDPELTPSVDDFDALLASMDADMTATPKDKSTDDADMDASPDIFDQAVAQTSKAEKNLDDKTEAPKKAVASPSAEPDIQLEDLDALIDDIMSPNQGDGSAPKPAPEPKAQPESVAVNPKPAPAGKLPVVEEDSLTPETPASKSPETAKGGDLDELANNLAQGPLLAAIQTMVSQELDARFSDLEKRLAQKIDKAAAASAAKIIREEIATILQDL